jgi:hypothetical protein
MTSPTTPPTPQWGTPPAPRRGRSRLGLWAALGAAAGLLLVLGCLGGLVLLGSIRSTTTGPQVPAAAGASSPTGSPSSSAAAPPAVPSGAATSPAAPVRPPTTAARATTAAPARTTAPALSLCGAPPNPYGFNFCGRGHLIYAGQLPDGVCSYFACIDNFYNGSGYMVECGDGRYSMSGGKQGACSYHDKVRRSVYSG